MNTNIKKLQNTQGRKELQQKIQELERIDFNNMNNMELLFNTLDDINKKITLTSLDENLKQRIEELIEKKNKLPRHVAIDIMNDLDGGKIIKNKKTRRRMGRTRHKKHHKTNKKHKKHQTSGKNKTRKSKKAKRKNKTR